MHLVSAEWVDAMSMQSWHSEGSTVPPVLGQVQRGPWGSIRTHT